MWWELAAILNVVTEPEHRDDQRRRDNAGPQRPRIPHLGARAHEHGVDEGQYAARRDEDGRRLPRPRDVAVVDAVDPAGVEVEEVEDDVATIRHGENEEVARRI